MFLVVVLVCLNISVNVVEGTKTTEEMIEDFSKQLVAMNSQLRSLITDVDTLKTEIHNGRSAHVPVMRNNKKNNNNTDLEERVAALEEQMIVVIGDVIDLGEQVENAEAQIVLLKSDQVLQDQRLLELEDDTDVIEGNIEQIENNINSLQANDNSLNASLLALEESVIILHETDNEINAQIDTLSGSVTDINEKLIKLEVEGTIAFNAEIGSYDTLPVGSTVIFSEVKENQGNAYDSTTGQFVVPSGGAGLYYFFAHFIVQDGLYATFRIEHNGAAVCDAAEDESEGGDQPATSCGAVVLLAEGKSINCSISSWNISWTFYKI